MQAWHGRGWPRTGLVAPPSPQPLHVIIAARAGPFFHWWLCCEGLSPQLGLSIGLFLLVTVRLCGAVPGGLGPGVLVLLPVLRGPVFPRQAPRPRVPARPQLCMNGGSGCGLDGHGCDGVPAAFIVLLLLLLLLLRLQIRTHRLHGQPLREGG